MWTIKPLVGKYYGTEVTNGERTIRIWTGYCGEASIREINNGWSAEDRGFDHVESATDYKYALAVVIALNCLERKEYYESNQFPCR